MNKGIEGEVTPLILLSIQPSPKIFHLVNYYVIQASVFTDLL
jgi:hypothetical protein